MINLIYIELLEYSHCVVLVQNTTPLYIFHISEGRQQSKLIELPISSWLCLTWNRRLKVIKNWDVKGRTIAFGLDKVFTIYGITPILKRELPHFIDYRLMTTGECVLFGRESFQLSYTPSFICGEQGLALIGEILLFDLILFSIL